MTTFLKARSALHSLRALISPSILPHFLINRTFFSTSSYHCSQTVTKITHSKSYPKPHVQPKILPPDEPIEEELLPGYEATEFCPINPGDVFNDRYRAVAKIGWGSVSTVWLARDLKISDEKDPKAFVTLKISTGSADDKAEANHELDIIRRIRDANPKHPGLQYIRTYDDSFEVEAEGGSRHVVLVQQPMRESLRQYRARFEGDKLPRKLVQGFVQCWLQALKYLHEECGVVHADIKDDNILLSFESPNILPEFTSRQLTHPPPFKPSPSHPIYTSTPSFGPLATSTPPTPLLTDFGVSAHLPSRSPNNKHYNLSPIQPRYYRSPEVILGAGWSFPADIWNLGVFVFTVLENRHLFHHVNIADDNTYDVQRHLKQIYALLGPVPEGMLQRIEERCRQKFEGPAITNDAGVACETSREYFGGPYFDDKGELAIEGFGEHGDVVEGWENKAVDGPWDDEAERQQFLAFVRKMIRWDPEERATASELLEDEWLTRNVVVSD